MRKLKTNALAVSNLQMTLHLGSFAAFTATSILLLVTFHLPEIQEFFGITVVKDENTVTKRRKFNISIEWICVLFIALSELPIVHIINSLVTKSIQDLNIEQKQAKILEEDMVRESTGDVGSIQDLDDDEDDEVSDQPSRSR